MIVADLAVIEYLLQAPVAPPARIAVFPEWKRAWKDMAALWATPVDRALAGGGTGSDVVADGIRARSCAGGAAGAGARSA